ncbi:PREDICTED: arylsulfatase B-like [Atta cephalotes]|uniref:Sulfatase N-terminal domain-containing protein n=1 Tax=Atta cephalotes TaxID=12957 RepID=A0A158NCS8_ATTCE|nr:PREDICTED: arylsulfatase B-like [Atta cephalotes]
MSSSMLSFAFLLIVLSVTLYFGSTYASTQSPNIVVIIADDLGWNDVSFHGADEIPTPNIDALAYNGVILNRHYVMPMCTPSRVAFLSGRHPLRTSMQGYPLKGAEPRGLHLNDTLLPEYLRKLGYTTHLLGKWHVGYLTRNYVPTRRGFDTFLGYFNGLIQYFNHTLIENEQVGYDLHRIVGDNHTIEYRYDYMTNLITEEAENIILSHNTERPMYLQLAHLASHASNAEEIMEVYDWKETNATLGYIQDINRRKFASVVATLDKSIGRVVDALNKKDMLKNTIILFISDNGAQTEGPLYQNFGSNYPLRGLKSSLYEGGVRGAACIYSPLIENSSRVSTQLFHITDWLPTLYSAAGGNSSDLYQLDGIDQWSTIKTQKASKRKSVVINIEDIDYSAALMGRYKLVQDKSDFQKHYIDYKGNDPSYPKYNMTNVLESPAASAIANVSNRVVTANKIEELRKEATVVCENLTTSDCENRTCLFDIYEDPCEVMDISSQYPEIVKSLNVLIECYKRQGYEKAIILDADPAGYPSNSNNYTWIPWLPDDYVPSNKVYFTINGAEYAEI